MIKINIDSFRCNLVEYALSFQNKKYTWSSRGPDEFDEAGFVFYVYKMLFNIDIEKSGYGLDGTSRQMTSDVGSLVVYVENTQDKEKYIEDINLGDLLFFHTKSLDDDKVSASNKYPGHVGIYIGDGKFIHASSEDEMVVVDNLDARWLDLLVASKDIIIDFKDLCNN